VEVFNLQIINEFFSYRLVPNQFWRIAIRRKNGNHPMIDVTRQNGGT
jgi:hypothetical protein